jgi:hypothetical protein
LDEGSGTIVFDSSGNGNHGTINNAAGGGLGNNGSVWVNDSERGMVISFNGADGADSGAVVITDLIIPAMTMENDFTWAFWGFQHADQATNNDLILGNRYGGTESPLQFIKFTPTRFEFYNVDGSYTEGINYDAIPGGVWVHHVIVKDGTSLTYYRNGEVAGINTISKTIDENPFYMGGDIEAEHWQGYLSDVRLYTKALSTVEVLGVMQGSGGEVWPYASEPTPADGTLYQDTWVDLSWRAGDFAVSHDVYFGENFNDVSDGVAGTFQGNQTTTSFTVGLPGWPYPDGLVMETTYYWRIDEVEADGTTVHKGDVWSFTVSSMDSVEDFETGNFSKFSWRHSGDSSWTISEREQYSGAYSARAGEINDEENSTLRVDVECVSGNITFYRKVSSERDCDILGFYIDGIRQDKWSGEKDWVQVSFPVEEGTRTFEWIYSKDDSISRDSDTAWIDDIVFPVGL